MRVDMNNFSSIKAFAERLEETRVDIVVQNAGVWKDQYDASPFTGWEERHVYSLLQFTFQDI